jgi:hypothetical protein
MGLEEMNKLELQYTYAWKYHKETPCVAIFISNKQKHHVFLFIFYPSSSTKLENRRVDQVPSSRGRGGSHQWEVEVGRWEGKGIGG